MYEIQVGVYSNLIDKLILGKFSVLIGMKRGLYQVVKTGKLISGEAENQTPWQSYKSDISIIYYYSSSSSSSSVISPPRDLIFSL